MEKRIYRHNGSLSLESGEVLPQIEICYHISREFGKEEKSGKKIVWIEEDNSEKPLGDKVGEGYGIITEDGRICIYVEGTVYQNSLLPAIYLMFRRKI